MSICANTVANALKKEGFASASKMKKPLLSKKHRQARLEFAQRHQHWTDDDWNKVVWSDESKINRLGSDGRKWCCKKAREGLLPRHVQPTLKFGGGSIMVWGCMTAQGVGYMAKIDNGLDADLYCEILKSDLMQTLEYYELEADQVIFQQDNDPKHTSKKATQVLKELSLDVLKWPAQSPDLNPIEHLWDFLKRKLADYPTQPKGMLELWDRVKETWESIDKETCLHLIKSIPRRIEAVLKARGGYTKY
jgi:transposase